MAPVAPPRSALFTIALHPYGQGRVLFSRAEKPTFQWEVPERHFERRRNMSKYPLRPLNRLERARTVFESI